MKTLVLNIGLRNNPLSEEAILEMLATDKQLRLIAYVVITGKYNGEDEPTLVVLLEYWLARESSLIAKIENLCSVLNQDMIPMQTNKTSVMAFHPSYTGEDLSFDAQYFTSFLDVSGKLTAVKN